MRKCENPPESNAEKLAYSAEASRISMERSFMKIRPRWTQNGACSDFAEPSRMSMERSAMNLKMGCGLSWEHVKSDGESGCRELAFLKTIIHRSKRKRQFPNPSYFPENGSRLCLQKGVFFVFFLTFQLERKRSTGTSFFFLGQEKKVFFSVGFFYFKVWNVHSKVCNMHPKVWNVDTKVWNGN